MRALILVVSVIVIALLVYLAAILREHGQPSVPDQPSVPEPVTRDSSVSAQGGLLRERVSVKTKGDSYSLRTLVRRWLFDVNSGDATPQIRSAFQDYPQVVCQTVLQELHDDAESVVPRLQRDTVVANTLLMCPQPNSGVMADAARYKKTGTNASRHRVVKTMIALWPCFDTDSCSAALADAISGLAADDLWRLLRERLRRDPRFRARLLLACQALASSSSPDLNKLSLGMNAMIAFSSDASRALEDIHRAAVDIASASLNEYTDQARSGRERFGIWSGPMTVWALALAQTLTRDLPYGDAMSKAGKLEMLEQTLDAGVWPSDRREANVLQRTYLEVTSWLPPSERVKDFQKSLVLRSTVPGVRGSALAMYGTRASVSDLRQLMADAMSSGRPGSVDGNLQVAYFAAIDNARKMDPILNAEDASKAFSDALIDESSPRKVRAFILDTLEQTPMPSVLWALQQVANRSNDKLLAEQARRVARITR